MQQEKEAIDEIKAVAIASKSFNEFMSTMKLLESKYLKIFKRQEYKKIIQLAASNLE